MNASNGAGEMNGTPPENEMNGTPGLNEMHDKPSPNEKHASPRTSKLYNYGTAVAAFVVWGGWAYIANSGHETGKRVAAFLTQGTYSFVMTLVMVGIVTAIFTRLPRVPALRIILPGILTLSVTGTILALVHIRVGTPRIAMTIGPALAVAFAFCLLTAWKLHCIDRSGGGPGKDPGPENV